MSEKQPEPNTPVLVAWGDQGGPGVLVVGCIRVAKEGGSRPQQYTCAKAWTILPWSSPFLCAATERARPSPPLNLFPR